MNRELKVGDRIRDNDPRMGERVLTVTGIYSERARARDWRGNPFLIQLRRIHTDGKPRRSGFSLVEVTE